jgi:hypothetical protein
MTYKNIWGADEGLDFCPRVDSFFINSYSDTQDITDGKSLNYFIVRPKTNSRDCVVLRGVEDKSLDPSDVI